MALDYYRDLKNGERFKAVVREPIGAVSVDREAFPRGILSQLRECLRFMFGRFYLPASEVPIWLMFGSGRAEKYAESARVLQRAAKMMGGRVAVEIVLMLPAPEVKVEISDLKQPEKSLEKEKDNPKEF